MLSSRRLATWLAPIAALVLATTLLGGGSAGVLTGTLVSAVPIDDFPAYDPQDTCAPRAKRGTVRLAAWLQDRYPGSGSSGISRPCGSGGTSEHKEGRAFDWRLDARSARDRRYAAAFIARIRRSDGAGNVGALGRRMGIMYLIWDDRMWSASREYEPTDYRSSSCRRLRRCSATLRHRDHVHISLSWRGARGRTSWYPRADRHRS